MSASPTISSIATSPQAAVSSSTATHSRLPCWSSLTCLAFPSQITHGCLEGFGLMNDAMAVASSSTNTLDWLDDYFAEYVAERRRDPRGRVVELALALIRTVRHPSRRSCAYGDAPVRCRPGDNGTPADDGLRCWQRNPHLQADLRGNPGRIVNFVEEVLRLESPIKSDFRLARRPVAVGGVRSQPGTAVMLLNGAANRDPPADSTDRLSFGSTGRTRREHLAFGRGTHFCPGALARPYRSTDQLLTHPRAAERHPLVRRAPWAPRRGSSASPTSRFGSSEVCRSSSGIRATARNRRRSRRCAGGAAVTNAPLLDRERMRELFDLRGPVFALLGGAYEDDPYPVWKRLREAAPVHEGVLARVDRLRRSRSLPRTPGSQTVRTSPSSATRRAMPSTAIPICLPTRPCPSIRRTAI